MRLERKKSMRREKEAKEEKGGDKEKGGGEEGEGEDKGSMRKAPWLREGKGQYGHADGGGGAVQTQTRRGSVGTQAEQLLDEADLEIRALQAGEEGRAPGDRDGGATGGAAVGDL